MDEVVKGLYLGSMGAAKDVEMLQKCGITHVLSVMDRPLPPDLVSDISKYRFVEALDTETFCLLPQFDQCAFFIHRALEVGGRVLVHCVAGVSRSATAVAAYLMSYHKKSLQEAMEIIQQARREASPNSGFMHQLALYEEMGGRVNISHPAYRRYQLEIFSERVQTEGRVDSIPQHLLSPAESSSAAPSKTLYRCRKCRAKLFYSDSLLQHEEGEGESAFDWRNKVPKSEKCQRRGTGVKCERSLFVDPQSWMANGIKEVAGKVQCPGRCGGKLGSYVWYGERCPCGAWVAPAFHIQASKVDACHPPRLPPSLPLAPTFLQAKSKMDAEQAEEPTKPEEGARDASEVTEESAPAAQQ